MPTSSDLFFANSTELRSYDWEIEFNRLHSRLSASRRPEVVFDFRTTTWFDLWPLAQLLLLKANFPNADFSLLLPRIHRNLAIIGSSRANLRFLAESHFLRHAEKLGIGCHFEGSNEAHSVTASEIESLLPLAADSHIHEGALRVLSLTPLSDLEPVLGSFDLANRRSELFAQYASEPIVELGGLVDCLLAELIFNGIVHGGGSGYASIDVVHGLQNYRQYRPERYQAIRHARLNHPLPDWKSFYSEHAEVPYFQIMVTDSGPGIAASISEDPRRTQIHLPEAADVKGRHDLLEYAFTSHSSRLSSEERASRGLAEFTGLAAVRHVLSRHDGTILIREGEGRHVLGSASLATAGWFSHLNDPHRRNIPLPYLKGCSIFALVPALGASASRFGFTRRIHSLPAETHNLKNVRVHSIGTPSSATDVRLPLATALQLHSLSELSGKLGRKNVLEILDLHQASRIKNELWPNLRKILVRCMKQRSGVVLVGLTAPLAARLEDYIALDNNSGFPPAWCVIGLSDGPFTYIFGKGRDGTSLSIDRAKRISDMFEDGRCSSGRDYALLDNSGYVLAGNENSADIPRIVDLLAELSANYSSAIRDALLHSPAWIQDGPILLGDGKQVRHYLSLHSVSQMRGLYAELCRLTTLIASRFEFDAVVAVGAAARQAAITVAEAFKSGRGAMDAPIAPECLWYHDYSDVERATVSQRSIRKGTKALLIVDGIRSGGSVNELLDHVEEVGGTATAILALANLAPELPGTKFRSIPISACLHIPIPDAESHTPGAPKWVQEPTSSDLVAARQSESTRWRIAIPARRLFGILEAYNLLHEGHSSIFEQHYARSVLLKPLMAGDSPASSELVFFATEQLCTGAADCIVVPERSSILVLLERLRSVSPTNFPAVAVCRRRRTEEGPKRYDLDAVGRSLISTARSLTIADDASYTGDSLRAMLGLCAETGARFESVKIFVAQDALPREEREILEVLASALLRDPAQTTISCSAFFRMRCHVYWSHLSCPLCQRRDQLSQPGVHNLGFIERRHAQFKVDELTAFDLSGEHRVNKASTPLQVSIPVPHFLSEDGYRVSTLGGLLTAWEEIYLAGGIEWLIRRLGPSETDYASPEACVSLIELLSRDFGRLVSVRLATTFLDSVNAFLLRSNIPPSCIAEIAELLATWPQRRAIYCVDALIMAAASSADLTTTLGAVSLLLHRTRQHSESSKLGEAIRDSLRRQSRTFPMGTIRDQIRSELIASISQPRDELSTVAELVIDTCFLLGYFCADRAHHQVLRHAIELACNGEHEPAKQARTLVAQYCGHLVDNLDRLARSHILGRLDAPAPMVEELRVATRSLHDSFMPRGRLAEALSPDSASALTHLERILFTDTQQSLHSKLQEFLSGWRCPLSMALDPLTKVASDANASFEFRTSDDPAELEKLVLAIPVATRDEIFSELAQNLRTALFDYSGQSKDPLFAVRKVIVLLTIRPTDVVLEIRNSSREWAPQSGGGAGLQRVESTMAALGHRYERARFDHDLHMTIQRFHILRFSR